MTWTRSYVERTVVGQVIRKPARGSEMFLKDEGPSSP